MYGNVIFTPTVRVEMELGGTILGTEYDHIEVVGHLSLGGTLDVLLINGFTPGAGNTFNLFDWTTRSGNFAVVHLPALDAALAWNASNLYTEGVLEVGLSGDFNHDDVIDAADYVAWRKGAGIESTPANYNLWRTNFGRVYELGNAASPTGAVPEPDSPWPWLLALLAFTRSTRFALCNGWEQAGQSV
jgi:hypothetical protein